MNHEDAKNLGSEDRKRALIASYDDTQLTKLASSLVQTQRVTSLHYLAVGEVLDAVLEQQPDLLILSLRQFREEAAGAVSKLAKSHPLPIIILCSGLDITEARQALRSGAISYLPDGFNLQQLPTIAQIAMERFAMIASLQNELQRSREELDARKSIERAKGILIGRRNMTETEAHEALRRMAMDQGKTVRSIADTILSLSDILP
ncbi:MAG: ANTAR domain-containing protein [Pseudomonadota bacterium]